VANLPAATQNALCRDLSAVQAAMRSGLSVGRNSTADAYYQQWLSFCQQHQLDTYLRGQPDPIPWLQIFGARVRNGHHSASGHCVRSGTVADALLFVSQAFTLVGRPDPRHIAGTTSIDTRITRQLKAYAKDDTPPVRVKPLPIMVLHTASHLALRAGDDTSLALLDLMWIAFFFLLRPGEYLQPAPDSHPIRLQDVRLWSHSNHLDISTCDPQQLLSATFVSITFDRQKNGRRGEPIGHGTSGHPTACPVLAVARRVRYLRTYNAPLNTPLCAVGPSLTCMVSAPLTTLLRRAIAEISTPLGIASTDITAKSLRSTGAITMLCLITLLLCFRVAILHLSRTPRPPSQLSNNLSHIQPFWLLFLPTYHSQRPIPKKHPSLPHRFLFQALRSLPLPLGSIGLGCAHCTTMGYLSTCVRG
jgi:hypothetical protein